MACSYSKRDCCVGIFGRFYHLADQRSAQKNGLDVWRAGFELLGILFLLAFELALFAIYHILKHLFKFVAWLIWFIFLILIVIPYAVILIMESIYAKKNQIPATESEITEKTPAPETEDEYEEEEEEDKDGYF